MRAENDTRFVTWHSGEDGNLKPKATQALATELFVPRSDSIITDMRQESQEKRYG
jgi:hypothetical protein